MNSCVNIAFKDFRRKITSVAKEKANLVIMFLRTIGSISDNSDGTMRIYTDADICNKTKKLISPISDGDLAWVYDLGFVLVIDTHPRVNNDGHHCRVIKVTMSDNGHYRIDSKCRSRITVDENMLRIRSTSFDLKQINKLTYERYKLFIRLAELNDALDAQTEG